MEQKKQAIAGDVVVLSGAVICGDVSIASGSSVWFNAVVRGDEAPISIGENTNIQDCAVLHVDEDCPLRIGSAGDRGHGAILHGCTVGDNALIGMGSHCAQRRADRQKLYCRRRRVGYRRHGDPGRVDGVWQSGETGAPPAPGGDRRKPPQL